MISPYFSKHLWMNWRSRLINFNTFITQVWFFHQKEVWSLLEVSLLRFCLWKHCIGKILHLFCYLRFQLSVTQHRSASRNTIGMFTRQQVCVYDHFLSETYIRTIFAIFAIFALYLRKNCQFLVSIIFWTSVLVSYTKRLLDFVFLIVSLLALWVQKIMGRSINE